jgi:GntR family transcriptional regulator/MocR family aminotransferase
LEIQVKNKQGWASLHAFQLERDTDVPLFRQLYLQIRAAVLSRVLRPGSKLPSTRELAAQLRISRTAVVSAYEQLLAEGYTVARKGAGTYISSDLPEPFIPSRSKRIEPASPPPLASSFVDVTMQNDDRPFNLGRTLVDARTAELWRKMSARAFRRLDASHLGYGDPRGTVELRRVICDYLRAARAVKCDPDQIVVTAGTQQATDIVIRVLRGPQKVWVEDPGYPLTRYALQAAGMKVCPIPIDEHGIDVRAGSRLAPDARAVFVTPSHQFPIGVALSMARRLELLAWARASRAWIVEDDYASEFRYGGRPLASLQGLDDGERVIYIGTMNKALFPGLRLGYAVVPRPLVQEFVTNRYLMDRQPSTLCQAVFTEFMQEGHFAGHIRRMRVLYREQRDALVAALVRRLGDHLSVEAPDQGMHLVAYTRKGVSDTTIERSAREAGVIVRATSRMYVKAPPRSGLMLGFCGYPRRTIETAVARLAKAVG